jgi:hypothetical protein
LELSYPRLGDREAVKKRVVWTKTPGDHEAKEKTERGGGIGVAVHYNCSAQSEPTTVPEVSILCASLKM